MEISLQKLQPAKNDLKKPKTELGQAQLGQFSWN